MRRSGVPHVLPATLAGMFCVLLPAVAMAADTVVDCVGLAFVPDAIIIDAGDTVTWTNLDAFHNVAEVDGPTDTAYNGTGFYSGSPGSIATWQRTFNTPGTYYYICEPHVFSGMRGSITVQAIAAAPVSDGWALGVLGASMAVVGVSLLVRRRRART